MIPLSAKEIVRVPVEEITYLVSVPSLLARAAYRRDVQSLGAVYHSDASMLNTLRDGIRACVVENQQAALVEIVNSYELESEKATDLGDDISEAEQESLDDLRDRMTDIEQFMQREYDEYNAMSADRGYWLSVAPIVAFRHFVKGWEGSELRYKERGGLLCEEMMNAIPPEHIDIVGWKAITLMSPTGGQEKNSESQSQSAPDPATLTADDIPPTAVQDGT
jgi:hypothetical protein